MNAKLTELINQVQAQYGVLGLAVLVFFGIVLFVMAVKLTQLLVKIICWVLCALVFGAAAWWLYARFIAQTQVV